MSKQYDNVNKGAIWKNDNRQSDNHPHFSGSINIDGKDYWLSGWKRKDDAAPSAPLVSFSVRPKDEQRPAPVQQAPAKDSFEDDIPW